MYVYKNSTIPFYTIYLIINKTSNKMAPYTKQFMLLITFIINMNNSYNY